MKLPFLSLLYLLLLVTMLCTLWSGRQRTPLYRLAAVPLAISGPTLVKDDGATLEFLHSVRHAQLDVSAV